MHELHIFDMYPNPAADKITRMIILLVSLTCIQIYPGSEKYPNFDLWVIDNDTDDKIHIGPCRWCGNI